MGIPSSVSMNCYIGIMVDLTSRPASSMWYPHAYCRSGALGEGGHELVFSIFGSIAPSKRRLIAECDSRIRTTCSPHDCRISQ